MFSRSECIVILKKKVLYNINFTLVSVLCNYTSPAQATNKQTNKQQQRRVAQLNIPRCGSDLH